MCRLILLALVLALSFLGCSSTSTTLHPSVVIDDSFTPEELAGILDGLAAWEAAVPQIRFTAGTLPHGAIYGAAVSERFADAIYIQRNEGIHDRSCPGWTDIGDDAVARTFRKHDSDQAIICIDATFLNAHEGRWKAIAMHEVGHALRLDHMAPPSVMVPTYPDIADDVTCQDKRAIAAAWSLPPPSCE